MAMVMHLMSQRLKFSLTCGSMSTQMQQGILAISNINMNQIDCGAPLFVLTTRQV